MPVRRRYVDTPAGQVHVRTAGEGPPVVLLHWTPSSGRMYEPVMESLAARGRRAIAPDLMGYGRSDPRPVDWTIADFAANVDDVLAALGVAQGAVVGGHLSACIAVELALRPGHRVSRLVLDGCPLWSPELRARMAQFVASPPPRIAPDGAHRTLAWERVLGFVREWRPGFEPRDEDLPWLHGLMIDWLETRGASSAHAMARYDLAERLPALSLPTLLLTADGDPLAPNHGRAVALVRDAREHRFTGGHPLHEPARAEMWATVVDDFLRAGHEGGGA
jgi:pimeloyl-ACP methyl ester carboxylesterase